MSCSSLFDTTTLAAADCVPLENVLIGIRCYETDWTAPLAGCRYSLTAQLLPFTLQPGDRIVSPMGRIYRAENANGGTVASPATHIYRVEVGGYDTLGFDIERDGSNHSAETNAGLVGVALQKVDGASGVMIGDSVWDAVAAGKLDVPTIAVRTGGFSEAELREAGAFRVYESLVELHENLDGGPLARSTR